MGQGLWASRGRLLYRDYSGLDGNNTGFLRDTRGLKPLTYSVPGVFIDLLLLIMRDHRHICCPLCGFLAGAVANIGGTCIVSLAFFNLPLIPLLLSISLAALSGGLGGLLAFYIITQLRKMKIAKSID